ncbi:MAG: T9SS type A sorting domain-containing protein [Bacteroidales bacterium]|nr:T9SS type A sorting domain-containing protein [Bacteroidales bacterium]
MRKSTFKFSALLLFMAMGTLLMAQTQFNVTFTVDMTNADPFDPATDEVYVSGSFAGWAEPGTDETFKMTPTDTDPMIYSITLLADSGQVQYKYFRVINGEASWENGEWNGDPNRVTILLLDNLTFANVWANKPYWITFQVDMTPADPFDPAADKVFMTGDFAGWMIPGSIPELMLSPIEEGSMTYTTQVLMYPGEWQYKYFRIVDNNPDWGGGEWDGGDNRVVAVDTADKTVDDLWGDINAGIFDTKVEFTYDMYPNPVVSSLNISGVEDVNKIDIYDISGKLVRTFIVDTERVSMNLSELKSGVYIISLYNKTGVQTSKFIKK